MDRKDLVPDPGEQALALMPVMDIKLAQSRRQQLVDFVRAIMVRDVDYGVIPGTEKPVLLKPGAEKLATFFGLSKRFLLLQAEEDWTGSKFGEPLFYYVYRCELSRGDIVVATADGSCNSWEPKYRYRWLDASKPDEDTLRRMLAEGTGRLIKTPRGWIWQERRVNRDIAAVINTIQKMAQKRALIAATLLAVNASEFFAHDIDELPSDGGEPDQMSIEEPDRLSNESKRPYHPEILRTYISELAAKARTTPTDGGYASVLAQALETCLPGANAKEREQNRHTVQKWLTGYESMTEMPPNVLRAMGRWLAPLRQDGRMAVSDVVAEEARSVLRQALIDAGQMSLPQAG
jgi:hypothetical protein